MNFDKHLVLAGLLALGLAACSGGDENNDEDNSEDNSAVEDMGAAEDMSSAVDMSATEDMPSTGEDMSGEEQDMGAPAEDMAGDMSPDMGAGDVCTWPALQIAGDATTDALADAAARCGQPAHAWLREGRMGEVTAWGSSQRIPKATLAQVLSMEEIDLGDALQYDAQVEQFSYMTQDRGAEIEATAALAYPRNADEIRGVLLVLHGTTGFMDDCAPSKSLVGQALPALFASFGYLVVAPDFIGLKSLGDPSPELHPYLVGQATAIASLDALRALPNMPEDKRGGFCPPPEYLVFGGSQGGHAALWVDRLAPYYASELTSFGGVATVPPADLFTQMERALQSEVSATGNTIAFLGSASSWYGAADQLDEVFNPPYDVEVPMALKSSCDPGDGLDPVPTFEELFNASLLDAAAMGTLADADPWGCMAAENGLTTTSVARINQDTGSYGLLMVYGEEDNLVHTPIERDAFTTLCGQGMPLGFLECQGAGHTEASFYAMPEILEFLDARGAGEAFAAPCEVAAPVRCSATPDGQ